CEITCLADLNTISFYNRAKDTKPWDFLSDEAKIKFVAFSPDSRHVLLLFSKAVFCLCELKDEGKIQALHYKGDILSLAFDPEGGRLALANSKNELFLLDFNEGKLFVDETLKAWVEKIAWAKNGRFLTVDLRGALQIWEAAPGRMPRGAEEPAPKLQNAEFDPEEKRIFAVTRAGTAFIRTLDEKKRTVSLLHDAWIHQGGFLPGTGKAYTISQHGDDWKLCLWDPYTGAFQNELKRADKNVKALKIFAATGAGKEWLVASYEDNMIYVWDLKSMSPYITFKPEGPVRQMKQCKRDGWLVTVSEQGHGERWPLDLEQAVQKSALNAGILLGSPPLTRTNPSPTPATSMAQVLDPSWKIACSQGNSIRDYQYAEEVSRSACKLSPSDWKCLRTYGAAEYRLGNWDEALALLEGAGALRAVQLVDKNPAIEIFITMANYQLDAAKIDSDKFKDFQQQLLKSAGTLDKETADLLVEAEKLILPSGNSAAPYAGTDQELDFQEALYFVAKETSVDQRTALFRFHPPSGKKWEKIFDFGRYKIEGIASNFDLSRLAFMVVDAKDKIEIWILEDQSLEAKCVCRTGWKTIENLALHSEGRKIYLSRGEKESGTFSFDICWIDAEGPPEQQPQKLLACPDLEFRCPHISPDRRWISFAHSEEPSWSFALEIWLARLSLSGDSVYEPLQLTSSPCASTHALFSPDNRFLFWTLQKQRFDGTMTDTLQRMEMDGSNTKTIVEKKEIESLQGLTLSRSGWMAYIVQPRNDKPKNDPSGNNKTILEFLDPQGLSRPPLSSEEWSLFSPAFVDP
ncbi:MAG: WD40 repeat domain-containing protein, partial [Planctomycetota bacterium]